MASGSRAGISCPRTAPPGGPLWFRLWKLRLYRQPSRVFEETTHLAAYPTFIATGATLLAPGDPAARRDLVLALFALNLAVAAVDVLSERASRAPLGGLPPVVYLYHVLVTSASAPPRPRTGGPPRPAPRPLDATDRSRAVGSVVFTTVLPIVEGAVFTGAIATRARHRTATA